MPPSPPRPPFRTFMMDAPLWVGRLSPEPSASRLDRVVDIINIAGSPASRPLAMDDARVLAGGPSALDEWTAALHQGLTSLLT